MVSAASSGTFDWCRSVDQPSVSEYQSLLAFHSYTSSSIPESVAGPPASLSASHSSTVAPLGSVMVACFTGFTTSSGCSGTRLAMCSTVSGSISTEALSLESAHHFLTASTAPSTLGTRAHSVWYPLVTSPETSSRQSDSSLCPMTVHCSLPGKRPTSSWSPTRWTTRCSGPHASALAHTDARTATGRRRPPPSCQACAVALARTSSVAGRNILCSPGSDERDVCGRATRRCARGSTILHAPLSASDLENSEL
eukprot:scaffold96436_cov72-Phaeocystis_antarctica.AAC.2